jgi:AcrR family transcriptional regulator
MIDKASTTKRFLAGDPIHWASQSEWIVAPQQERSRTSLRKVLVAAARLFIERGYDETTMADIARDADVAVGSIYKRFPDKNSILSAILEGYRQTRYAEILQLTDAKRWSDRSAVDIVTLHVDIMYSSFLHDEGVLRLIERRRIFDPAVTGMLVAWNDHVSDNIARLLEPHAFRIPHRDLKAAVRFLHNTIRGSLVWAILPTQGPRKEAIRPASPACRREAVRMALAYLGLTGNDGAG